MLKKIFLVFILLIITIPQIIRAEEMVLSLEEAISIALRDNRDILLKVEDLKKAKAKIAEAQASLFPTFTASGSLTDTRSLYSKDLTAASAGIGIKQYLYKGGKIISTIKSNEYGYIASQAILDKTKLDTVFNVKKAFYTLLLAQSLAEINQGILDNTQEHLDFYQARFASGEASESDLIKMRSALANVQQAYTAALNQISAAQATLNNLLYLVKEVQIKAQGRIDYEPKEIIYDQAFLKAMQTRPEIKQYEAQIKSTQSNIEVAKADNRPNIYGSWDYYSRSHTSSSTQRGWNDYNVLGLTVSWPIFDGWLTKAKVEQAVIDLKEANLLSEKTVKDIALEVKSAYLDLKNAIEKIKSVSEQTQVYQDNLQVIEEKYQSGFVSQLDLHDAELSRQVALFNQIQANYDYVMAKAKFDKATGGTP